MSLERIVVDAPAPFGALTLGIGPAGLAAVLFGDAPLDGHARRLGVPVVEGRSDHPGAGQFREYLDGRRRAFDLPLDWSLTAGSGRRVLQALHAHVPYGTTTTYGALARRGGLGQGHEAARGVGSIMGSNPLVIVVPCHRVLAADGLGGFGGGRAAKEWLLALEGVLTPALDLGW